MFVSLGSIMVWFCWVGSASEELLLKRRYINWRLRLRSQPVCHGILLHASTTTEC